MDECIKNGKITPFDMCQEAKTEILTLEEEVKKIEGIRTRQSNLRAVIRQLGGVEVVKKTKRAPTIIDSSITEKDLDPYIRDMCAKVCNFIESSGPVGPRQIMDAVASVDERKLVIVSIKWLWDQSIITRDEGSLVREISKGKSWDKRPTL
jgi:hypothetical protein